MGRHVALSPLVGLKDFRDAADILRGVAVRTPLLPDDTLSERLGAPILYKPETLQRVGAFKFRGAYNRLVQLSAEERVRGVVAFSSGNHSWRIHS